jgi:hypothetical protein
MQRREVWDSPLPQALPREEADFDFCLVKPTSVRGRVMDGEAVPNLAADFLTV